MRVFNAISIVLSVFSLSRHALAANSFAGSNLYYAAGLSADERSTLLGGMQSAGMKVLRVWLDGESTATTKNTTITAYPDLEPVTIGTYNDTVLDLLDEFMVDAHSYGIKLLISMHSWNALSSPDVYGKVYGTGYFYQWSNATSEFDNRLRHVLNHQHTTLGVPWKSLKDYIFAFEAENEAMIGNGQTYIEDHQSWQCDRAATIKNELGPQSGILVATGGESWMDESVQPGWLNCTSLDVISIHAYGVGDLNSTAITTYVQRAQSAGKKLLFEEWGACYYTTENNVCSTGSVLSTDLRNTNITNWANNITAAGVPWLYWQVLPNADPHYDTDYEIGIGDPSWSVLQAASLHALTASAAFDFSAYLLPSKGS